MTIIPTQAGRAAAMLLAVATFAWSAPLGQAPETASDLPRWLAGCWSGGAGNERFHERWTSADPATLLGVGYTVTKERLTSFEYFRIVMQDGHAVYIAQPGGVPATEFSAASVTSTEATFENLAHDFPKRVSYRLVDATHLLAWIDGGPSSPRRIEFAMQRVPCEP
jgi:hypothetical protein